MNYKFERAGISHNYEILSDKVLYTAGQNTRVELPFTNIAKLAPGPGDVVYLVPEKKHGLAKLAVWLDAKQMPEFLNELFANWGRLNRGAAAKASFDYSANERVLGWLWVTMSLIFPGMLALLLLSDGLETMVCDKVLPNGSLAQAQVTKITKTKRGNWAWDLAFTTASGQQITGRRTTFVYNDQGRPTGDPTVVYSPEKPHCWDLSMHAGQNAINYRQRVFTMYLTLTLGGSFGLFTVVGVAIGWLRLRRRFPYAEDVKKAGAPLLKQPA